jgi:GNAT superfamily N-acetyltransferase
MPLGARGRRARSRPRPAEEDRIIDVSVFERGHVTCWVGSLSVGHPGRPDAADRRPPMASRWLRRPVQTGRAVAGRVRWRARLWRHTRLLGDWLRLEVRPCTAGDLELLGRRLATGAGHDHDQRFAQQQAGRGYYLVAWLWGEPVGHLLVTWTGPDHPPVRQLAPSCAHISAAGVVAPLHSRGIGTALVNAAEILASRRGHQMVGLARGDGQPAGSGPLPPAGLCRCRAGAPRIPPERTRRRGSDR